MHIAVFTQSSSSMTKSWTYCGNVPKCRTRPSRSATPTGRVRNIPSSSTNEQNTLSFQAERILFIGKGAVDGPNTIAPAQSRESKDKT